MSEEGLGYYELLLEQVLKAFLTKKFYTDIKVGRIVL